MVNRMSLKVSLDVKNGKWKPGLSLINDPIYGLDKKSPDDKIKILNSFSEFLSERMSELLQKRIRTQYSYLRWEPLSPGYAEFKRKVGLKPGIWQATGLLTKSITHYRENDYYVIGIDPNVKYPDSHVSVLFVAKCMEFGTRYMPARPLFGPTVTFMRRHVRQYWELFLEQSLRW